MLRTHQILSLAAMAFLLVALSPVDSQAQEGGPLLKSDLVRMMTASNYTGTEMAAIVRMNCVGFEPTDRDRNQLSSLPNADVVLLEVDRCTSRPRTTAGFNRGIVKAAPVEQQAVRTPPKPRGDIDVADLDIAPAISSAPGLQAPAAAMGLQAPDQTKFVRREIPPKLANWDEVSKAFLREYRPAVRTPGTVVLSLTVGADGSVLDASVKELNGDPGMAEAALQITGVMKFEPAMMRDRAVESLTELPIHFSAN
jgi:TonB family protein